MRFAFWRPDSFWTSLQAEDRPKLDRVRAHYHAYEDLLSRASRGLAQARVTLTHGDLAGDNIMLTGEGRLAIMDWGSARISADLVDAASLVTYMTWSADERRRFYNAYLDDLSKAREDALDCLETLSRLHRYRSCVQSLLWLNDESQGLDAVGRAYFETQLWAL